jgi:hypothetical protein
LESRKQNWNPKEKTDFYRETGVWETADETVDWEKACKLLGAKENGKITPDGGRKPFRKS